MENYGYNVINETLCGLNNTENELYAVDCKGFVSLDYSDMPYYGELKVVPIWEIVIKSILFVVIILFSILWSIIITTVYLYYYKSKIWS